MHIHRYGFVKHYNYDNPAQLNKEYAYIFQRAFLFGGHVSDSLPKLTDFIFILSDPNCIAHQSWLDKWNVDCWFSQEIKDKIQHEKADMHHTKHQIY